MHRSVMDGRPPGQGLICLPGRVKTGEEGRAVESQVLSHEDREKWASGEGGIVVDHRIRWGIFVHPVRGTCCCP